MPVLRLPAAVRRQAVEGPAQGVAEEERASPHERESSFFINHLLLINLLLSINTDVNLEVCCASRRWVNFFIIFKYFERPKLLRS